MEKLKNPLSLSNSSVNGELPDDVINPELDDDPDQDSETICRDIMCRDTNMYLNKYVIGAVNLLEKYDNSVTVLPTMDNTEYDELLSKNIVFLKLKDAGAVNTIIECIVRNTPVVVNRLASVEEILGTDYPLYFEDIEGTPLSLELVESAYTYLYNMDKAKFKIEFFMSEFLANI